MGLLDCGPRGREGVAENSVLGIRPGPTVQITTNTRSGAGRRGLSMSREASRISISTFESGPPATGPSLAVRRRCGGRPVCAKSGPSLTAWRTGEFDPERESRARPVLYMKPRPVSDDPRFWAGLLSGNTVAIATTVWLSRFADSSFPKADADGRHIAEMVEPSYAGERLLCTKSYPGVLPLFLPRSTQNLCDRQT